MTIGTKIKPRVFLEGVEIEAYRVTIQNSIGQAAVAVVEVPPAEEFFERTVEDPPKSGTFVKKSGVIPRTVVHIFYEDIEDPDGATRLLFEGELVRYEYAKEKESRCLRLYASDLSNVLSSVYVRYYSDFFTPYGSLVSAFTGSSSNPQKPDADTIKMAIINQGTGLNPEILKALQDDKAGVGVASAFREIARSAVQKNTFFRDYNDRTKISDKLVALVDRKSKTLLETTQLASLIQQNMSNLKESATIWDLYTMLMSLVFYFPVSIPAAPFIPKKITDTGEKGGEFVVSPGKTLASFLLKPYTWWTAPANFNVIFPSQYKSFRMGRNFLSEPTRIIISAFGVIENLAREELKKLAPSSFIFIAPEALAKKFDREIYDTRVAKIAGSPTVSSIEVLLQSLTAQKRTLESQAASSTLPSADKLRINQQIIQVDTQITAQQTRLKSVLADIERQTAVESAATSRKGFQNTSATTWNRNVLGAFDDVSACSREDLKGIIFSFDYLTQTQVELTKSKGISPLAMKNYLANVANYKLSIQQYKDRFAELSMHFSPNLVAGFTALVVDPVRNYFGEVDTVTHILDARGIADTQVQLSFVRSDEIEFAEASRSKTGETLFPSWINDKYLPSSIGDQVYKVLFPENRPDPKLPGIQAADSILVFGKNQTAAAAEIRRRYFNSRDPEHFALAFTRRNIASIKQVFVDTLGASLLGQSYIFSGFSDERYQAAQEYAAASRQAATLASSDNQTRMNP